MHIHIIKTQTLFFLLFLTHSFIHPHPDKTVTNSPRSDGFGSQFLAIIGSVIDAEINNYTFAYTPFTHMEHNYTSDPHYLERKEQLINFVGNFPSAHPHTPYAQCNYHHREKGGTIIAESNSLHKIRNIFRANKDIKTYLDTERFTIAVHIRRPNTHDSRVEGTDVPDHTFLKIITALRKKYGDKNPLFYIFSQGAPEQFKQYEAQDILLRLNETVEDTFPAMVFADVLVTSPSAFSYVAALLSERTVYYIPFAYKLLPACKPLPHWIATTDLIP